MPYRIPSPPILVSVGIALAVLILGSGIYFAFRTYGRTAPAKFTAVRTLAGTNSEFGEPFGVAVRNGEIYVSDGKAGKIWRFTEGAEPVEFASGLETPSAIAFDKSGDLIVADSGSHTIKRIDPNGNISRIAGTDGESGDVDGPASIAKFNAPVGVAVLDDGSIVVADTYNDKIKLIANGLVKTLAGSSRGFADGIGASAKFDTPTSVAAWADGRILVADTLNSRIRVVETNGKVWTLAGNSDKNILDGLLSEASFYRPSTIAVSPYGEIFIADGNTVRAIRDRAFPFVATISKTRRGFVDGPPHAARFNRISGIAFDRIGDVIVADSDNSALRVLSAESTSKETAMPIDRKKRTDPAEFRTRQPARWPYEPPDVKRDIAGTLGEIRGVAEGDSADLHFHNGLDIAGSYGEKAYFIRDEKVLDPVSTENFGTLRELLRLPEIGYIHLRLGRDSSNMPLGDSRFQFNSGMTGVRVRRGTKFKAGDVIGTLNPMNHVHLIAGPPGDEMNALEALILPGIVDTTPPVIEGIEFFDENWQKLETGQAPKRITLAGKTRIVVRAFDRVDGNPDRRRLGVFRAGYQLLKKDLTPISEIMWNIGFDRNPDPAAVRFAYATGSRSGATGETIFKYIVTNSVDGDAFREGFLNTADMAKGEFVLRVFAADYFYNITSKDTLIEVTQ